MGKSIEWVSIIDVSTVMLKNAIDHIVYEHDNYYCLVLYLYDMSVTLYECVEIPISELQIVKSIDLVLNMKAFDVIKCYDTQQANAKQVQVFYDFIRYSEIWDSYRLSYQEYMYIS